MGNFDLKEFATTLIKSVEKAINSKCSFDFTKDPDIIEKNIIEYDSRMRVNAMEKFNGPCYVAAFNFYLSPESLKSGDVKGTLILYLECDCAGGFLKKLGHKFDDDDQAIVCDYFAEFGNLAANQFKNDISSKGFADLTISAPLKGINDIFEGVPFPYDEYKYYELSFHFLKQKGIVASLTMSPIPSK